MAFNIRSIVGRNRPLRPTDAASYGAQAAVRDAAEAHTNSGWPNELPRTGSSVMLPGGTPAAKARGMASLDQSYYDANLAALKSENMRNQMDRRDVGRPSRAQVKGQRKTAEEIGKFASAAKTTGSAVYGVTDRMDFEGDPTKDPGIAIMTSTPGTGGKLGAAAYQKGYEIGQKRKAKAAKKSAKNAPADTGMSRPPK
jgi:hypothetical protein